jgi:hypothetical protein
MQPLTDLNRPPRPNLPDPQEAADAAVCLGIPPVEVLAVVPHEAGRVVTTHDHSQYLLRDGEHRTQDDPVGQCVEGCRGCDVYWYGPKKPPKGMRMPLWRDELEQPQAEGEAAQGWTLADLEALAARHGGALPHASLREGWLMEDPQQTPIRAYILAKRLSNGRPLRDAERYDVQVHRYLNIVRTSGLLDPYEAAKL